MALMERIYSILVVNSSYQLGEIISPLLPETRFYPVKYAKTVNEARRAMLIRPFDLVVINSPLPDENGIQFALDCSKVGNSICLLLSPSALHSEYQAKLRGRGVFLLKKPIALSSLTQAIDWIATASDRMERKDEGKASLDEKMEEIKIVNRAKWALIENLKMTEEEAHRYITKEAMDRGRTKKEVALVILSTYSN